MARVSALSTKRILPFESGDTTQAMLAFRNGATATIATSLKTPGFVWRLAVYGSEMWAESLSETRVTICRRDGKPETFDVPQTNHIGANLDSFAAAALGHGQVPDRRCRDRSHGRGAGGGVRLGRTQRRVARYCMM